MFQKAPHEDMYIFILLDNHSDFNAVSCMSKQINKNHYQLGIWHNLKSIRLPKFLINLGTPVSFTNIATKLGFRNEYIHEEVYYQFILYSYFHFDECDKNMYFPFITYQTFQGFNIFNIE